MSTAIGEYVGAGYRKDGITDKGKKPARFTFKLERPGRYDVRVAYTPNPNRATNVPVAFSSSYGETTVKFNERDKPEKDGLHSLGVYRFDKTTTIPISNAGTDGFVVIDAVQFVPAE